MGYSTNTVANLPIILRKPPLTKKKEEKMKKKKDKMHKGTWDFEHATWNKEQIWGKKLGILQEHGVCSPLRKRKNQVVNKTTKPDLMQIKCAFSPSHHAQPPSMSVRWRAFPAAIVPAGLQQQGEKPTRPRKRHFTSDGAERTESLVIKKRTGPKPWRAEFTSSLGCKKNNKIKNSEFPV